MSTISAITLQGLIYQSTRLAVAADNIVNAGDSTLPTAAGNILGAVYQPKDVAGVSLPNGGVIPEIVPRDPATALIADTLSPTGYSAVPSVDLASEMVTLTMASNSYRAAAKLLAVDANLSNALLDAIA